MIKQLVATISAVLFVAASVSARGEADAIPAERVFMSSAGDVTFHHEMHFKDLGVKCVQCHHSIDAKKLNTPHPDYLNSSSVKCGVCHGDSGAARKHLYACSACHGVNPMGIADETLSAKVVVHQKCWSCHPVGTGKEASKACEKCHSGKKTY